MRARITPKKRTKPTTRKKVGPALPRPTQSGAHRGEDVGRFGDEVKPRRGEAC
jgi:hypothetical protein